MEGNPMKARKLSKALILPLLAMVMIGCSHATEHRRDMPKMQGDYAPFFITFDREGQAVVLDRAGKPMELKALPYKLEPGLLKQVNNITAMEVYGSHFYVLIINGKAIRIDLPHFN
jgi:hypothetical protein